MDLSFTLLCTEDHEANMLNFGCTSSKCGLEAALLCSGKRGMTKNNGSLTTPAGQFAFSLDA